MHVQTTTVSYNKYKVRSIATFTHSKRKQVQLASFYLASLIKVLCESITYCNIKSLRGHTCWSLVCHKAIREHFATTLPREVVQWHCDDTGACMCQLSWDWPLSLSTDWRWDLEEKLLLLCLLYGSFFTLNAENLFRGQRIPASPWRPQLILAALSIDKAFSGAKYAAYVLHLSSLYFPVAQSIGTCSARVCWALGNVSRSSARSCKGTRDDQCALICEQCSQYKPW